MPRKPVIPDPLKRRHLLEDKLDPAKAVAIADGYLEEGRTNEALAFLVKADAREQLEELRDRAVEDGDPFLLRHACEALGEEPVETPVPEVSPAEVAARLARRAAFLLLDVREPHEIEIAAIEGSTRIPLAQLEARVAELADWKERPIVVHCKTGGRSARGVRLLCELGFKDVVNLAGGIDLWAESVDPSLPRY